MNTTTISPSSIPDPLATPAKTASFRCPYLYPNGKRCSLPGLPAHSGFCRRHSPANALSPMTVPVHNDSEDLSLELLPELSEFSAGTDIRQFLARLLTLLAKGRISPRRASVLAFITNQLLHSNRAAILETTPAKEQPQRIIIDMPGPNRDWPEPETKPRPADPTYADLRS
jgi:hypothetical protein